MKSFMILGALVGFLLGSGVALACQNPWATALWRGCATALAVGVLTRWWSGIWLRGLREALEARHNARHAAHVALKPGAKP